MDSSSSAYNTLLVITAIIASCETYLHWKLIARRVFQKAHLFFADFFRAVTLRDGRQCAVADDATRLEECDADNLRPDD
jgi:hypothetical protein